MQNFTHYNPADFADKRKRSRASQGLCSHCDNPAEWMRGKLAYCEGCKLKAEAREGTLTSGIIANKQTLRDEFDLTTRQRMLVKRELRGLGLDPESDLVTRRLLGKLASRARGMLPRNKTVAEIPQRITA